MAARNGVGSVMTSWWNAVNGVLNMVAEGVLLDGWDDGGSGGMAIVSVSVRISGVNLWLLPQAVSNPLPGDNAESACI